MPAETPLNRATSSRNAGRNHLGTPGDIIPECRAKSSRNAERHQIGMVGDIIAYSRATSPGIRSLRCLAACRGGWIGAKPANRKK